MSNTTPQPAGSTVILAGAKGAACEGAAEQLSASDVVEHQAGGVTKKQWTRIGTSFLSRNGGAYNVDLDGDDDELPSSPHTGGSARKALPPPAAAY